MKKFILMLAATAAFALPLSAQTCCNDGYYISGFGGANFIPNVKIKAGSGSAGHAKVDFDTGYFAGAALGYKLSSFRLETEFSYRNNDLKLKAHSRSSSSTTQVAQATATTEVAASESSSSSSNSAHLKGDTETYAVLANFYYDLDFCNCWNLKPYVGAGIGYAHNVFKGKLHHRGSHQKAHDRSDKFAWQIIAGVAVPVTDCIDLALEYRYFDSDVSKVHNHNAGAALRFWF